MGVAWAQQQRPDRASKSGKRTELATGSGDVPDAPYGIAYAPSEPAGVFPRPLGSRGKAERSEQA